MKNDVAKNLSHSSKDFNRTVGGKGSFLKIIEVMDLHCYRGSCRDFCDEIVEQLCKVSSIVTQESNLIAQNRTQ
jgi:hypothetical protein